ncbi:hypothetical protein D9M71_453080 [compost metagenome]
MQPGLVDKRFERRQRTLPTGSHHHLGAAWLSAASPHGLKIQGQVFQRKRKQTLGIRQQLSLHPCLIQFQWQLAPLADHLAGRQCQRYPALPQASAAVGTLQGGHHHGRLCHPVTASRRFERFLCPGNHPATPVAPLQLQNSYGVRGNFHPHE